MNYFITSRISAQTITYLSSNDENKNQNINVARAYTFQTVYNEWIKMNDYSVYALMNDEIIVLYITICVQCIPYI